MSNLDQTTRPDLPRPPCAPGQRYVPGTLVVGKYRLQARLGEGGMGTVWLAQNVVLDAPVALKLIHPSIQGEETVERLLVEARVQAKLNHPNIVRVFDFGQTEFGDAFIIMEVLQGVTLGDFLHQRGRLSAIEAVQIMLPIVGALCHAHDNGVVHRDLKPDNIFLVDGDLDVGPKLFDFGIAKLTPHDPSNRHFTPGGALLGSPAYMAPEQAWALEDVDHRADIWAVCVVLYEAVSGMPAFPGQGYTVLRKVVQEALPALEDRGGGEGPLSAILAQGLKKDRTCRFQSMRELGTALAQWLYDQAENDSEDLYGHRISRSWKVVTARSQPSPAVSRHSTSRRFALVACLVFAGVFMALKVRVEAAPSQHRAVDSVAFASEKARIPFAPIWAADVAEAPVLLTRSIAPLRAEVLEKRDLQEPKRSVRRLSEVDLGLKVPY